MSRFRVMKSKGKFYVVTTDSNGLAGGPYATPVEAEQRVTTLAALEAAQAARLAQPEAHRMNIQPGYRSPDVEDSRGSVGLKPLPWDKVNGANGGDMDWKPGDVPPWKKHHIPVDPFDPSTVPPMPPPEYGLRDLGIPGGAFDWSARPPLVVKKTKP